MSVTVTDLFCGAGGSSLGAEGADGSHLRRTERPIDGRDERRSWASTVLGRDVPSFSTVTADEAGRLIEWMGENWGTNA